MKRADGDGLPRIEQIRETLWRHYGELHWWPGDGPDEIAIGAVLTQNTAWQNVEKAINNLKKKDILSFPAILEADSEDLARAIRPAGYFNQKAKKLKFLAEAVCRCKKKTISGFLAGKSTVDGRNQLLAIWGIGMETADSILLYGGNRRIFVVDAYTKRIFSRHGIIPPDTDYEAVRKWVETSIPPDTVLYNEFHAGLVNLGKDFCHRRNPDCKHCPLKGLSQQAEAGEK